MVVIDANILFLDLAKLVFRDFGMWDMLGKNSKLRYEGFGTS